MPKVSSQTPRTAATQRPLSTRATSKPTANAATAAANQAWGPTGARGSTIDAKTARTAFWHSPYTNADAKAAQKAFNLKTVDTAKEFIGKAVITRNERPLEQAGITRARWDNHDCAAAFARSPYSEADARQALKKLPFLSNVQDAKEYIGLKIVNKTEDILSEVGVTRSPYDRHDMMTAFKRSGFSEADVAQAKKKFDFLKSSSTNEVKEYLGLKVLNSYTEMMAEKGITPGKDRHDR
jgi:hypothetical protein